MEITWLGHSCFRIKNNPVTIIADPYAPDIGYCLGKQTAQIVTVSHQHPGHSHAEGVGGEPRLVTGPGEYEISGVLIMGVATFHDNKKGADRGKNTVYVIEVGGVSVCHLGDLGHVLTAEQVEEMENVDVLLLPVGGVSTIDAARAVEVVRQIEPQVIIPMHYKTEAVKRDLAPVGKFLKEIGVEESEPLPKLTVNKTSLPPTTQVTLLKY